MEQGWIRAEAVELDEAADSIVVQMASMDVGTDVGAAPVEAGKETEDSKKANGDHHKAWAESERTVHTARKASPCSRRIVLAFLLQAACFVCCMFVLIAIGAGWSGISWCGTGPSKGKVVGTGDPVEVVVQSYAVLGPGYCADYRWLALDVNAI